jgi:hypothetical protein
MCLRWRATGRCPLHQCGCRVVHNLGETVPDPLMPAKTYSSQKVKHETFAACIPQLSVSFTAIEEDARQEKVSVAWVAHEAVGKCMADQLPLFDQEALRKR